MRTGGTGTGARRRAGTAVFGRERPGNTVEKNVTQRIDFHSNTLTYSGFSLGLAFGGGRACCVSAGPSSISSNCFHSAFVTFASLIALFALSSIPPCFSRSSRSHSTLSFASQAFNAATNPTFGRVHGRADLQSLIASAAPICIFHIRYEHVEVGAREIPRPTMHKDDTTATPRLLYEFTNVLES